MVSKDVNDNQESLFESISALVDNELSPCEESALMSQIKADGTLLEKWRHFYIIKAIMRKQVKLGLSTDEFVSKVMVHSTGVAFEMIEEGKKPQH